MRDEAVFCIDPEYVGVALPASHDQERPGYETVDGTKKMIVAEFANVILNRDAHAVVGGWEK